jgi:5-methylthioadenosine/S-adenosylhomocysteine deaminase
MEIRPFDIIVSGGTLLTMSPFMETIEEAVIGIRDGIIALISSKSDLPGQPITSREHVDAIGCLVLPGLVNTHTHLPMTAFRGLADDLPLMTWLNEHMFPAEKRYVNDEMVYASSMLGIAEMILSGTTTFGDGYFYENSVIQAVLDTGMRCVAALGFIDSPAPGSPDPSCHSDAAEKFLERWLGRSPLITPALFCHAPYTCGPETIMQVKKFARQVDVPFFMHVSETQDEVRIIKERFGVLPVQHLLNLDVLDERTVAVHCNWLSDEEINILADRQVKISHCPESNMKLAAGMARVPKMLEKGINIGLGTDGCASNNNLDLFCEMDTAAKIHKLMELDPTVMSASIVLKMVTLDGARILGLEKDIGSIEIGKQADLIVVNMNSPHLTPLYNPFSHLVYAACGADVEHSIIRGKIVMKNRKLLTLDQQSVQQEVRNIASLIRKNGL